MTFVHLQRNTEKMILFKLQELNPWIKIQLPKDLFIYKVQLIDSPTIDDKLLFQVNVVPYIATEPVIMCTRDRKRTGMVFECVPPIKDGVVQVHLEGNYTLTICDAFISGVGENF